MNEGISDKGIESLSHEISDSFSRNFLACGRLLAKYYSRSINDSGITHNEFDLMMMLLSHKDKDITNTELSSKMGMDRTTLTRNMESLARKGWVIRSKNPRDSRAWGNVNITPEGINLLKVASPWWVVANREINEMVSDKFDVNDLYTFKCILEGDMPYVGTKH